MTITREASIFHNDFGGGSLELTASAGNLQIIILGDRSGASHTTHFITDSGSAWTKLLGRDVELANSSFRRSVSVWWKEADATPDQFIDGPAGVRGHYLEFSTDVGSPAWGALASASNDNGTTNNATSLATGTTASTSGNQLVIPFFACRNGDPVAFTTTFASRNIGNVSEGTVGTPEASFGFYIATGFEETTDSGTKASTASVSGTTNNTGIVTGILVFTDQAASAATEQDAFRFRNDNGDEDEATWVAAQDTNINVSPGDIRRLRVRLQTTGSVGSKQFQLEYRKVGDTVWKKVT